jgi:hypothetical protein
MCPGGNRHSQEAFLCPGETLQAVLRRHSVSWGIRRPQRAYWVLGRHCKLSSEGTVCSVVTGVLCSGKTLQSLHGKTQSFLGRQWMSWEEAWSSKSIKCPADDARCPDLQRRTRTPGKLRRNCVSFGYVGCPRKAQGVLGKNKKQKF